MRTTTKYQILYRYRIFHLWISIPMVLFLYLFQTGAKAENQSYYDSSLHFNAVTVSNGLFRTDQTKVSEYLTGKGQFLKQRTTHPFSPANFSKTRPRGIPAQRSDCKQIFFQENLVHFNELFQVIHCPDYGNTSFHWFISSDSIRPPPIIG